MKTTTQKGFKKLPGMAHEAAEKYNEQLDRINKYDSYSDTDFIAGANWQKEQLFNSFPELKFIEGEFCK